MAIDYSGKKVAILGFSVEGQSSYRYFRAKGADITVCDANTELKVPEGVATRLGEDHLKNLDDFDLLVRTPGILPNKIATTKPVTSNMDQFLAICQGLVIGVTGTKGKGTVTTLIDNILKTAGKDVHLGGNIGVPPLDFVEELTADSITVLEMSNLQLWDIRKSPDIAVLLHLAPEHLDWHKDADEYYETKENITKFQSGDDLLVYNSANPIATEIAGRSKAQKLPYLDRSGVFIGGEQIVYRGEQVIATKDIPLIGEHNYGNVCAAIGAVWELVSDKSRIREGIRAYQGLPHRLELVAEKQGVKYYDDSIATHQDAAAAAIRAFAQPKVLILGGSDKGTEYNLLIKEVISNNQSVRSIILVGQMGPKIGAELLAKGIEKAKLIKGKTDMPQIVKAASAAAKPGDVVLLAPACASFDMFKSYGDRGDQFKKAVAQL